jgi:dTDP-glucose 4,6-dehydratase
MPVTEADLSTLLDGRPVLVTGADGFVGSHLVEKLLELGSRVHVFVRATSSAMLNNIAHVQERVIVHRGDLADKQAVAVALRALKSDGGQPVIFHLGAQSHVGESWNRPYETFATNTLGTLNLMQSIVDLDLDLYRLDTAGSSEEYGNILEDDRDHYRFGDEGGLILDERSPINPQSVYGTSKVAADWLTRNFARAYGLPTIVTRMFNSYGPRQNPRFITGAIISQALTRDFVELGYVQTKRDFCFIKDGVRGHLHATIFGEPGNVYVYGYGKHISMLDWYHLIIRIGQQEGHWGEKELRASTEGRGRLGQSEVMELRVDYSRLRGLTGWEPEYSWDDGLRETIRWYVENRSRWMPRVDWLHHSRS